MSEAKRSESKRSAVGGDWGLVGCVHLRHRCCRTGHEGGCPTSSHAYDMATTGRDGTPSFGWWEDQQGGDYEQTDLQA